MSIFAKMNNNDKYDPLTMKDSKWDAMKQAFDAWNSNQLPK